MDLIITNKDGITLHTANKYCKENVSVAVQTKEVKIKPSTEEQVQEGIITKVTVEGSSDLQPQNIVKDKEIFGVQGTYDGIDTSDATGQASDVLLGKTVYARGMKLEGTLSAGDYNASIDPKVSSSTITRMITKIGRLDCTGKTSLKSIFSGCENLIEIEGIDNTSNATSTESMFYQCYKLIKAPQFDTSNVSTMQKMFNSCNNLADVPEFNAENNRRVYEMFTSCTKLVNFGGLKNLGKAYNEKTANYYYYTLDLSRATLLTYESLINVINNLYDLNLSYNVAGGGTLYGQSLVLGSTNLAKLNETEIAIATSKGFNVT